MTIFPKLNHKSIYEKQIKKLKDLLNNFKLYCPNMLDEINILNELILYNDITFSLYYKNEIQNYQIINNIIINSEDLNKDIDISRNISKKSISKFFFLYIK